VSGGFLAEMAAGSRERVHAARLRVAEGELAGHAARAPAAPPLRLSADGFDLIAELKLRSPAAGRLDADAGTLAARVAAYAGAGAAAVSVLTEPSRFDGELGHLAQAAQVLAPLAVPAMRKDFLVDPYQVLEARVAGAGGVLVILRMLSRAAIDQLLDCARACGLFVLLEAFDAHDIERMHDVVGAHAQRTTLLAGVNCRDLATLEVVPQRLIELAPLLPPGVPRVAESGVTGAADAHAVAAGGYTLALVGSALMRGPDPTALARALLAAGRSARRMS
jgi:indole-3-glycerol phosphate synthase